MENNDEIKEDIGQFKEIDAVAHSNGGKRIIDSLKKDITTTIESMTRGYKTATHTELIALCASLESKFGLYQVLTNAKDNIAVLETIMEEENSTS